MTIALVALGFVAIAAMLAVVILLRALDASRANEQETLKQLLELRTREAKGAN